MSKPDKQPSVGSQRWTELTGNAEYVARCLDAEQYSEWTDPTLFPQTSTTSERFPVAADALGAQVVNHLANKTADVLFPASRPYLRLKMPQQVDGILEAVGEAATTGAQIPPEQAAAVQGQAKKLELELNRIEQATQDDLIMLGYRASSAPACKHLIVVGNVCIWHPETVGPGSYARVITLRDYVVVRDAAGIVIEFMTRLTQSFGTLPDAVRAQIRSERGRSAPRDETATPVYTHGLLIDGKYEVQQYIDKIAINGMHKSYPTDELPWLFLTWDRAHGRAYGTSLVAQFAGAFSAIEALSKSLRNISIVAGDIKIFVDPMSGIDVQAVNASASGTYHSGNPQHIGTPQFNKSQDVQFMLSMIERHTKQIAQSFLLMSAVTRDAERVTAEEIRRDAEELEKSNGGVYSRLAAEWQYPLAILQLRRVGYDPDMYQTKPIIVTGMASLSRASELDNLRMAFIDLAALNSVPEDVRARMRLDEVIQMIFIGRQVPHTKLIRPEAEVQAQMKAQQEAAMQQIQAQNQGRIEAEAAKGMTDG